MQNISSKDFYEPTPFNQITKEQIWMSQIADGHDNICHCKHPFAHLLANIFPPGHKDRTLSINQILQRDYQEKCLSGGGAASAGTNLDNGDLREDLELAERDHIEDADLEDLIAAGESAAGTR